MLLFSLLYERDSTKTDSKIPPATAMNAFNLMPAHLLLRSIALTEWIFSSIYERGTIDKKQVQGFEGSRVQGKNFGITNHNQTTQFKYS
jgi:hypothetical protein